MNSRTKHYFANPRIKIQENVTKKPLDTIVVEDLHGKYMHGKSASEEVYYAWAIVYLQLIAY